MPRLAASLAFLVLLLTAAPAWADSPAPSDSDLYIAALEAIVHGSPAAALPLLRELLEQWPDSPYAPRARELVDEYGDRLDRTGIVLFSITNLVTAVGLAEAIPAALQVPGLLPYGLSGLAGVGVSIAGSWLGSRGVDLSFGQELWMDAAEAIATTNFALAWDLATDPADASVGLYRGLGAAAVAVASRAAAYAAVIGGPLSAGKPAFILTNYGLALGYTLLTINSFLASTDRAANDIALMAVPTAAAAASYLLWDTVRWPDYRSGLAILGALGGGLTGLFADFVVSQLVPGIDVRNYYGIVLAAALAGHAAAALLTRGIPGEPIDPAQRALALVPVRGEDGAWGLAARLAL